jgi:hypothetical protein
VAVIADAGVAEAGIKQKETLREWCKDNEITLIG